LGFPIVVPPGRLGLEPHLTVAYDSSEGDGPLGMGFSLQGLSAITRCPANMAQDGYIAPVRYDGTDHFCLSGMRLVPVPSLHKKVLQTVEYRTIPDTFARIVAKYGGGVSGPLSFEVHGSRQERAHLRVRRDEDEHIGDAIQTVFPMWTEDAYLVWNGVHVPISYKYTLSFLIQDVVTMLERFVAR
jgi:hypothetical protein